jgi:alpha-D-xyloside xylohydrolase
MARRILRFRDAGFAVAVVACGGGDAETTDSGMAGTLRGGLSLGLSGFTFWSHDMGGFVERTPRELYSRWVPFGMR